MIKTPSAIRKAAVFQLDVPLTQLKPGFYTCQVNVIDDAPGQFRTEVGIACEVASTMCTIPLPNNGRGGGPPGVSRDQSQYIVLTRPQIMVFGEGRFSISRQARFVQNGLFPYSRDSTIIGTCQSGRERKCLSALVAPSSQLRIGR